MPHINDVLFGNQLKTKTDETTKHLYDIYSIGLVVGVGRNVKIHCRKWWD